MLPARLKISLIAAIILFFVIVLYLLKKRRLSLKYTLLWLLTGLVMLIFVIFPGIMGAIAKLLGIQTVMNTLYLLLLAFVLVLLMMLTSIVSKQTERIGYLAQSNAILEKRVRELEEAEDGQKDLSGQEEKAVDGAKSVCEDNRDNSSEEEPLQTGRRGERKE